MILQRFVEAHFLPQALNAVWKRPLTKET